MKHPMGETDEQNNISNLGVLVFLLDQVWWMGVLKCCCMIQALNIRSVLIACWCKKAWQEVQDLGKCMNLQCASGDNDKPNTCRRTFCVSVSNMVFSYAK